MKDPQPKMTGTPLFLAVLDAIAKSPEHYHQETYHQAPDGSEIYLNDSRAWDCDTSHCILGWAIVLAFPTPQDFQVWTRGRESDTARLFNVSESVGWSLTWSDNTLEDVLVRATYAGLINGDEPQVHAARAALTTHSG